MSSNETSGAPAEATATTPAPSAEFPTFGTTRGSGLARGKRPSAGPAAATAAAPSDYKPTAIEVVNAPREYTNPFAPAEEAAPAPVEQPPVVAPATPVLASSPVAADLATFSSAQVDAPAPIPVEPAHVSDVASAKSELNILPPAEQKTAPAQTWESAGFQPGRNSERPRREERPRQEERREESVAADEPVDIASIPEKFLYVRPGVTYVPTPRNWGGAPRERSNRPSAEGSPSAPREESPRASSSAPSAAPAKSGGFLGWLKSLFGGESAAEPVSAGASSEQRREGGGHRRNRGGRSRGGPGGGEGGGQRRHRGGRNRHRSGGESEGSRQGGI
jgi:translation initiation factor IF-2